MPVVHEAKRARLINDLEVYRFEARTMLDGEALAIAEEAIGVAIDAATARHDPLEYLQTIRKLARLGGGRGRRT